MPAVRHHQTFLIFSEFRAGQCRQDFDSLTSFLDSFDGMLVESERGIETNTEQFRVASRRHPFPVGLQVKVQVCRIVGRGVIVVRKGSVQLFNYFIISFHQLISFFFARNLHHSAYATSFSSGHVLASLSLLDGTIFSSNTRGCRFV